MTPRHSTRRAVLACDVEVALRNCIHDRFADGFSSAC